MLTKILIALAVIVIGFVLIVATRPSEYRVARTVTNAWNPWAKMDPAMNQTYEGAPTGVGAIYTWTGNRQVGEGRMTLTESRPSELIRVNLEFLKPFAATSTAEFTFRPDGQRTAVTWSMVGHLNFVTKVVHLFVGMDRLIGANFEKGLADMKSVAEGRS